MTTSPLLNRLQHLLAIEPSNLLPHTNMQRQIPGLGVVTGPTHPRYANIEQYNGIPYGSIPARFRQAKLVTSWPDNKWDGTKYG